MHKVPVSLDHPSGKAVPVVILNGLLFGLRLAACSLAGDRDLVSDNFPLHSLLGGSFLCQKLNYSRFPVLLVSLMQVTFLIYQPFISHKVGKADNAERHLMSDIRQADILLKQDRVSH